MNKSILVLTLICGTFIVGCTAQKGSHELSGLTQEHVEKYITDGTTTKDDILSQFGTKFTLEEDAAGLERWVYELTTSRDKGVNYVPYVNLFASGTKNKDYKLIVVFDENDTVIRHRFQANEYETSKWKR